MKDQYVGDINDFEKYSILALSAGPAGCHSSLLDAHRPDATGTAPKVETY